ncbi:virion structural protein [Pseudomonas phage PhiPA3]|uniref:Virion structural protein n=1 Tax=Pseudomonas phage PhiPA3 TaxID=998086 RepID=F8SJX1_BPPA3|nr:virion structural protein [Pseudomonas phage PhiPA3]AEH03516.1 virion structural protein [Pseudomonas phage PhiPA3]
MLPIGAAIGGAAGSAAGGLMATVFNLAKNGMEVGSLADLARPCRVEPLAIIDSALADQPYMQDLMKMGLSQFAGYYLQAVNMVLGVGKIDTLKVFDSLNPYRSVGGGIDVRQAAFSKETYLDGLPSLESFNERMRPDTIAEYSMEKFQAGRDDADTSKDTDAGKSMSSGDGGKIYETENLAVGKLLNVEIKDGDQKAKLPVLIRLIPAAVPSQTLTHIFTAGGRDSWAHRYFLVKTGQLRFWRDFIMGQDMIDAHFQALMKDQSGVYKTITDRRRNNMSKAFQSGRVSMADASNIAIISATTMKQTANALYAKMDDFNVRQKIFDNSYLLMLMVVDERWQRVTVYHRGVDLSSSYRLDEVKMAEKSKGQDITEIFKLFSKQMQTNI